jgi:hypothetical protein
VIAVMLTLVLAAAAAPAWADHGGGLSRGEPNPVVTALLWAGGAFLIGLAVIAIVTLWSRRRSPPPDA